MEDELDVDLKNLMEIEDMVNDPIGYIDSHAYAALDHFEREAGRPVGKRNYDPGLQHMIRAMLGMRMIITAIIESGEEDHEQQ